MATARKEDQELLGAAFFGPNPYRFQKFPNYRLLP